MIPGGPRSHHSAKPSVNGDLSGFSHGAFHSNRPSIGGFRDRLGGVIPSINTARAGQMAQTAEIQTPGTGYDMNYTPLLPSQLLMGSPLQPGSPSMFASPQFQNFSNFSHQATAAQPLSQPNYAISPVQGQQSLSPQMYQNMISPNMMIGAPQYFGTFQPPQSGYGNHGHTFGGAMNMAPGLGSGTSRTVYLGNIPADTSAEEILGHVRSGQIESVRLLPDKNCAFISFLEGSSAVHFHSDAILKKLAIRGQDIKIGWGKPSQVPSSVALAVQQSGASRNVYLGNLPAEITEEELREDLSKYGPIDTVKLVREKAIGFVHFLSIGNAMKAVTQLPQEPTWQPPRRVFYGKDRCAYVSKTQQQNAAQYLGIAPGYAHVLSSADRDVISDALAQQSVAAAAVATAAGGVTNLGNRTVYLGNIHPETTLEEICNVVRGGLLHHIRYIPDKHICFVTFIDPTSAASFFAMSNMQGLMIHNRRLKVGWGKHSGALPPAIALAVSGGASRNVYIGNIDESWSEDRLRQDFSEHGEIELVNTLRERSCAFVNFTNIANAIKAIEAVRGKDEYKRFKINFGKDRCGNSPRQMSHNNHNQFQQAGIQIQYDDMASPPPHGGLQPSRSSQAGSSNPGVSPTRSYFSNHAANGVTHQMHAPAHSTNFNPGSTNPLIMYLSQVSNQNQQSQQIFDQSSSYSNEQQGNGLLDQQNLYYASAAGQHYSRNAGLEPPQDQQQQYVPGHMSRNSFSVNASSNSNHAPTIGGLLAPSSMSASARAQHARAISLPAFPQNVYSQYPQTQQYQQNIKFSGLGSGLGGLSNGATASGYGLAIHTVGGHSRWADQDNGS